MATVTPVIDQIPGGGIMRIVWTLASGDTGADANYPGWADRNAQVEGVTGGATVALQGSNDGTNWRALFDMNGNSLAAVTAGGAIRMVQENSLNFRPSVTGGDVTTALVVTMIARRR